MFGVPTINCTQGFREGNTTLSWGDGVVGMVSRRTTHEYRTRTKRQGKKKNKAQGKIKQQQTHVRRGSSVNGFPNSSKQTNNETPFFGKWERFLFGLKDNARTSMAACVC